jgi:hypothetical protein
LTAPGDPGSVRDIAFGMLMTPRLPPQRGDLSDLTRARAD